MTAAAGWRDRAACAGMADPSYATKDPFFPQPHGTKGGRVVDYDEGLAVCRRCPVRAECLADALAVESAPRKGAPIRYGLRGAVTPEVRQQITAGVAS